MYIILFLQLGGFTLVFIVTGGIILGYLLFLVIIFPETGKTTGQSSIDHNFVIPHTYLCRN